MRKAIVLVGLVMVGCGSDAFDPSLPGSTPLNQLSAEQATTLCTESENYSRSALPPATQSEYRCRIAGVDAVLRQTSLPTDAETRTICKSGYDVCRANLVVPPSEPVAQVCATAMFGCSATVDQFAACLNDSFSWLSRNLPPCDHLTTAKAIEIDRGVPPPPSCEPLEAAGCGGLASGEEMMSSALRIRTR